MKIKEDLKRDVLEYLMRAVREEKAEDLALSSITEAVGDTKEKVEKVLEELMDEDLIDKHSVRLKIFVPETDEGKKAVKRFAKREFLVFSPYWAIFIAVAMFWIVVPYLELKVPEVNGLISAYREGIRNGILYAGATGLIGGYVIQNALNRFVKWRILSEETYVLISTIATYTVFLSMGGLAVYYLLLIKLGIEVSYAVVAIILGSLGIAIAYVRLTEKK